MDRPKHKLYGAAQTLFVEQGMTCAAIAEALGVREGKPLSVDLPLRTDASGEVKSRIRMGSRPKFRHEFGS